MSSFLETFLAALLGFGAFYLLEAAYYEVSTRVKVRQRQAWMDEWEEENWEEL